MNSIPDLSITSVMTTTMMTAEETAVVTTWSVVTTSENVSDSVANTSVMNWCDVVNRGGVMHWNSVDLWDSIAWCVHGRCLHGISHRRGLLVLRLRCVSLRGVTLRGVSLRGRGIAWGWHRVTLRRGLAGRDTWRILLHYLKIYFIYIIL